MMFFQIHKVHYNIYPVKNCKHCTPSIYVVNSLKTIILSFKSFFIFLIFSCIAMSSYLLLILLFYFCNFRYFNIFKSLCQCNNNAKFSLMFCVNFMFLSCIKPFFGDSLFDFFSFLFQLNKCFFHGDHFYSFDLWFNDFHVIDSQCLLLFSLLRLHDFFFKV